MRPSSSSSNHSTTCRHYSRECHVVAPCCGRIFPCHRCHDESGICTQSLARNKKDIREVVCRHCGRRGPARKACKYCKRLFATYFCELCKVWSNGPGFHCAQCGFCISAKKSETRHCTTCNACYPLSSRHHQCVPAGGIPNQSCAGCGKSLSRSTQRVTTMQCGHSMHETCFIHHTTRSYNCPLCRSEQDLKAAYGAMRRRRTSAHVTVKCNSCGEVSLTQMIQNRPLQCPVSGCHSSNVVYIPPSGGASSSRRRTRE